ncbi:MAG: DUF4249 domain-containing protein [Bacteroidota bacterium]
MHFVTSLMQRTRIATLAFLSLVGLNSCQDVIDLELEEGERQMVVDGWLTNDSTQPQELRLSFTTAYFSTENPPVVNGATAVLHDETTGEEFPYTEVASGLYRTTAVGVIGHSYSVSVRWEGEEYRSNPELLSPVSPINAIYSEFDEDDGFTEEGYYVRINTFDPVGTGDHYRWRYWINGELQNDPDDLYVESDDFVDGNLIEDFEVTDVINFYALTEVTINANGEVRNADGDEIEGDAVIGVDTAVVTVEQSSITREAYEFYFLLSEQTADLGFIFDPPPSPITGNIVRVDQAGTALGYFGVSAVTRASVVIVNDQ